MSLEIKKKVSTSVNIFKQSVTCRLFDVVYSNFQLEGLNVYLSGELSGGRDDEGSETLVEGLAKVGQQGQTEGHSLTGACRSTCQDLPFLKQMDQWNQNTKFRIRNTNTFV